MSAILQKKGTFLYGMKYGCQNPLTIHEIHAALTPKVTGLPSLLRPLAAAKVIHAEDYKI